MNNLPPDKNHPLWPAFLKFDKKRHAGPPDLTDQGDLECFEAFIAGYEELQGLFGWMEKIAQESRTGISFDHVPKCEDDPKGFRFMRHHFISEPKKTIIEAIKEGQAEEAKRQS